MVEATTVLSSSLDYQLTLTRVAELAVPKLADWCGVDILEGEPAKLTQVAVAHVDRDKVKLARELGERYPNDPSSSRGAANVARTGRSELYAEIPDEMLTSAATDAQHLRLMRVSSTLQSAVVVPLTTGTRVLGAITFVYADSGRRYGQDDVAFAEELGRRGGIAVENARLYAAEQRARESADAANRTKDEFLATVSHELRTPLSAIVGWSKMLTQAKLAEDQRARAIETIERNAVSMAQLIEDLLDVSRIVSGKMRLEVGGRSRLSVIESAALESIQPAVEREGHRHRARARHVRGRRAWRRGAPPAGRLEPPQQRREVHASWRQGARRLAKGRRRERDRRLGQRTRHRPTVPAARVRSVPAGRGGHRAQRRAGSGWGSASASTSSSCTGAPSRPRATGRAEARRSRCASRPRPPRARARRAWPSPRTPRPTGAPRRAAPQLKGLLEVLVVDDEDDARELVRAVLEQCGSVVRTAESVDEALVAIKEHVPDVLVSDIGMPHQSGYDLMRKLRALPREQGGTSRPSAITAYARSEDRKRVLGAGYMLHVPKPIDPTELVTVVAELARARKSESRM